MPKYTYKAKEGPNKIIDRVIDADSIDSAVNKIIQLGLTPIDVAQVSQTETEQEHAVPKFSFSFQKKISLSDKATFTRQMSDLVEASIPLLKCLESVYKQTRNTKLKGMIDQMYVSVQDGSSLSDALGQYPDTFSLLYVNLVRSGELSGNLDIVLSRLSDYLEKDLDTTSKVRASLAYPTLIFVVGTISIFVLLTFFIPKLFIMFEDMDQRLPLPTMILMGLSGFVSRFWWVIIGGCALVGTFFSRWISTEMGRMKFDQFKLNVPILKELIKVVEVERFARTLGTLVEGGVDITTALNSVWMTIDNVILRDEIRHVAEEVTQGTSLQAALSHCTFFPELATNIIAIGEETGRLEKGLYKIADTYQRESDRVMKTMVSLLGPIVLIFVVAIVGFVVIATLLPILQMNLVIQ